jgi:hypothetical protein
MRDSRKQRLVVLLGNFLRDILRLGLLILVALVAARPAGQVVSEVAIEK